MLCQVYETVFSVPDLPKGNVMCLVRKITKSLEKPKLFPDRALLKLSEVENGLGGHSSLMKFSGKKNGEGWS